MWAAVHSAPSDEKQVLYIPLVHVVLIAVVWYLLAKDSSLQTINYISISSWDYILRFRLDYPNMVKASAWIRLLYCELICLFISGGPP